MASDKDLAREFDEANNYKLYQEFDAANSDDGILRQISSGAFEGVTGIAGLLGDIGRVGFNTLVDVPNTIDALLGIPSMDPNPDGGKILPNASFGDISAGLINMSRNAGLSAQPAPESKPLLRAARTGTEFATQAALFPGAKLRDVLLGGLAGGAAFQGAEDAGAGTPLAFAASVLPTVLAPGGAVGPIVRTSKRLAKRAGSGFRDFLSGGSRESRVVGALKESLPGLENDLRAGIKANKGQLSDVKSTGEVLNIGSSQKGNKIGAKAEALKISTSQHPELANKVANKANIRAERRLEEFKKVAGKTLNPEDLGEEIRQTFAKNEARLERRASKLFESIDPKKESRIALTNSKKDLADDLVNVLNDKKETIIAEELVKKLKSIEEPTKAQKETLNILKDRLENDPGSLKMSHLGQVAKALGVKLDKTLQNGIVSQMKNAGVDNKATFQVKQFFSKSNKESFNRIQQGRSNTLAAGRDLKSAGDKSSARFTSKLQARQLESIEQGVKKPASSGLSSEDVTAFELGRKTTQRKHATFGEGKIARVLRKEASSGDFKVEGSSVFKTIYNKTPESVQKIRKAAPGSESKIRRAILTMVENDAKNAKGEFTSHAFQKSFDRHKRALEKGGLLSSKDIRNLEEVQNDLISADSIRRDALRAAEGQSATNLFQQGGKLSRQLADDFLLRKTHSLGVQRIFSFLGKKLSSTLEKKEAETLFDFLSDPRRLAVALRETTKKQRRALILKGAIGKDVKKLKSALKKGNRPVVSGIAHKTAHSDE